MRCSRGRGEGFSGACGVFPVGVSKECGGGRGSRLVLNILQVIKARGGLGMRLTKAGKVSLRTRL